MGSLSLSAPYPENHRRPGLAPFVGLSGFPSCLYLEKLENIQWKVKRRVKVQQDESCNERLGFSLVKRRLKGIQ